MKKILLIEDNDDIRNNTAEILELSNYKVIVAENGKVGVENALKYKPDLIVCDIMMPVLDGYGVLHAIHNNEEIKNTPFIFLTAKSERGDFRKGMELGADDYITKPFDTTELLNAVHSRLTKHDLLKQELSPGLAGMHELINVSFGKNALDSFIENSNTNIYKRRQVIYTQGNHPSRLFYVIKGKIKTYKTNESGKALITELFGPGDFLGYVALLEESVYHDSAEALEETELALIPKEDFDDLIIRNHDVAKKFISLLAKNVSLQEEHLIGLAYNSLRKKVAEALVMLQAKFNKNNSSDFLIDITRDNLAALAGTASESLIRTLSDFRQENMIDLINGSIKILNIKKLETLAN